MTDLALDRPPAPLDATPWPGAARALARALEQGRVVVTPDGLVVAGGFRGRRARVRVVAATGDRARVTYRLRFSNRRPFVARRSTAADRLHAWWCGWTPQAPLLHRGWSYVGPEPWRLSRVLDAGQVPWCLDLLHQLLGAREVRFGLDAVRVSEARAAPWTNVRTPLHVLRALARGAEAVGEPVALRVQARPRLGARCPFCRESLLFGGLSVVACPACGTCQHQACVAEGRRCVTLGCPGWAGLAPSLTG